MRVPWAWAVLPTAFLLWRWRDLFRICQRRHLQLSRTYVRVEDAEGNVILENETQSQEAMKETTAYFMNKLLKGAVDSGTGSSAKFSGMTIAGKTGTTNDNYTRYFVGYTPYYVAAVWTGYKYNARISYSGNPAITLWKKVMRQVHEDLPNKDFETPPADWSR